MSQCNAIQTVSGMKKMFLFFVAFMVSFSSTAQDEDLRKRISEITSPISGKVGVSILNLATRDTLSYNGKLHFAMQSVYKFPQALAWLDQVDKGKTTLDAVFQVMRTDLHEDTWSPMAKKYAGTDVKISLRELIGYTVSWSDNNACDILFREIGGPAQVNRYIHNLGVKEMAIVSLEEEMHRDPDLQYKNWSTPDAMIKLLDIVYQRRSMSNESRQFLLTAMTESPTGPKRIKGMLPPGTEVAHKTGTSGASPEGITGAVNDVGIVRLPDGNHFAIAVFITGSKDPVDVQEKVIAQIALAAWQHYTSQ